MYGTGKLELVLKRKKDIKRVLEVVSSHLAHPISQAVAINKDSILSV